MPRDSQGFQGKPHPPTEQLMRQLVNAALVVKTDGKDKRDVGPLIKEVRRQRKTVRPGS